MSDAETMLCTLLDDRPGLAAKIVALFADRVESVTIETDTSDGRIVLRETITLREMHPNRIQAATLEMGFGPIEVRRKP